MRRVCLTSIPGFAPIAFKINGASHMFDQVNGIRETVGQLALNLRKLCIFSNDPDEVDKNVFVFSLKNNRITGITPAHPQTHHAAGFAGIFVLQVPVFAGKSHRAPAKNPAMLFRRFFALVADCKFHSEEFTHSEFTGVFQLAYFKMTGI